MPSSYTQNLGIEKPSDGEQDGIWGDVVNANMEILDRAINGGVILTLSGTSSTLTTTNGTLSDGQNKYLIFSGTLSATHTVSVSPNSAEKLYFVRNTTGQSVVIRQGSGSTVTVLAGDSAVVYCDGAGSSAGVTSVTDHLGMSSPRISGGEITNVTMSGTATVSGGSINNTPVGNSTPSTGAFTTLSSTGQTTMASARLNGQLGLNGDNYGTVGQLLTSAGAGAAPVWSDPFPSGGIIMWSGSIVGIPTGWLLCNGQNGTPDLRDRFIVGAGSSYAPGATGGANSVTLTASQMPVHSHTFSGTTSTGGAHSHTTSGTPSGSNGNAEVNADQYGGGNSGQGDGSQIRGTSTDGNHNHTFSGTTSQSGDGQAHENRPPYYALAYIMKS